LVNKPVVGDQEYVAGLEKLILKLGLVVDVVPIVVLHVVKSLSRELYVIKPLATVDDSIEILLDDNKPPSPSLKHVSTNKWEVPSQIRFVVKGKSRLPMPEEGVYEALENTVLEGLVAKLVLDNVDDTNPILILIFDMAAGVPERATQPIEDISLPETNPKAVNSVGVYKDCVFVPP
jgi:hypothetical protein